MNQMKKIQNNRVRRILETSHSRVFFLQISLTQYNRISNLLQHPHSFVTSSSPSLFPTRLPKRIRQTSSQITQGQNTADSVKLNIPSDCELFALVNTDCIADSQRFKIFTTPFRNLALRKWEDEASRGADPKGLRHEWGIKWVPLPNNLSIHEMPILRSHVVETSKKN
jgi:hypothetical protein